MRAVSQSVIITLELFLLSYFTVDAIRLECSTLLKLQFLSQLCFSTPLTRRVFLY